MLEMIDDNESRDEYDTWYSERIQRKIYDMLIIINKIKY